VIYAPCFHDGKVVAFAASRAHWVDIGGSRVGFGSVETTEIYQEGLQFRSLKIYEAGKRNETLWQIIHDNVRFAEAALGDLRAQIAACQLGIRRYGDCRDLGQHRARGARLHRRGAGRHLRGRKLPRQ
jgi:N-methylhydantoinase B